MSLIVAARFGTFEQAENTAAMLMKKGIHQDEIQLFFVNPAGAHARYRMGGDYFSDPAASGAHYGAVVGAAVVGLIGALVGGLLAFTLSDAIMPIVGGAGVGAYIGSLGGAMYHLGRKPGPTEQVESVKKDRASGVVVAVHAEDEAERSVAMALHDAGGVEVERAQGQWVNGRWEDFDSLAAQELEKDL